MFVFGVLGVFSVKYRKLAKESFECTFRLMTLRPCQSDFDQKLKVSILAGLIRFPKFAKFVNKNFKPISVIMVILFFITLFLSVFYTAEGLYYLATTGTCSPEHPEHCIFTPMFNQSRGDLPVCVITGDFVEFYGEGCQHCTRMIPVVEMVENETGVIFQKIEIWNNESNKETFLMHADAIERDCGMLGVPAFYAAKTDRAICGEISAEKLKQFIRENG